MVEKMKTCTIDGCNLPYEAKGYCAPHYHRNRKTGSPHKRARKPNPERRLSCAFCGEEYSTTSGNSKFCSVSCRERSRYNRDREKRLEYCRQYRASNRDEISERRRNAYRLNIEKHRISNRNNYLKHREERIKAALEYQAAHPEVVALSRAKRRAAVKYRIKVKDHKRLLSRHNGRCAYCGVKLCEWGRENGNSLQWDHVVPLSRGGVDGVSNLVPSCRDCNLSKSNSTVMEWRCRKAHWYINREIERMNSIA